MQQETTVWDNLRKNEAKLKAYLQREWVRYRRTSREIARKLKIHPTTISRAVKRLGLKQAKPGRQQLAERKSGDLMVRTSSGSIYRLTAKDFRGIDDPSTLKHLIGYFQVRPRTLLRWAKLLGVPVPDRRHNGKGA